MHESGIADGPIIGQVNCYPPQKKLLEKVAKKGKYTSIVDAEIVIGFVAAIVESLQSVVANVLTLVDG